jgi:outer membrane protein TolC
LSRTENAWLLLVLVIAAKLAQSQTPPALVPAPPPAADAAAAQSADAVMTLTQIETIALANQPRLLAAQLRSRASSQRIRENRSALFPSVAFNATGV